MLRDPRMLIIGLVIVLVAVFAGAFIHPLLFLIGLSVIIVAFIVAIFVAITFNFLMPRLMPGDPVDAMFAAALKVG